MCISNSYGREVPWVPSVLLIAAAPSQVVSRAFETIAIVTGVFAAGARAFAILNGYPPDRVEWMTAAGFAAGTVVAVGLFTLGRAWS